MQLGAAAAYALDGAFSTAAFATGSPERSQLMASYELRHLSTLPQAVTLVLAVRPFQVNPPSQFLNTPGGGDLHLRTRLGWPGRLRNGARRIFPFVPPDAFRAASFDAGALREILAANALLEVSEVRATFGYASGALVYHRRLLPRKSATVGLVMPLFAGPILPTDLKGLSPREWLQRERDAVAARWRAKRNRVALRVPPAAQALIDTLVARGRNKRWRRPRALSSPGSPCCWPCPEAQVERHVRMSSKLTSRNGIIALSRTE